MPHPITHAPPFTLPLSLLDVLKLVLVGQGKPDGRAGAFVRRDGVPGRAEPARYVEGENAEVEGEEGERDDGGGAYAGVGNVDFRLWGGGWTVFVV